MTKIKQQDVNSDGGDIAGGNIIKPTTYNNNTFNEMPTPTYFALQKLKDECDQNIEGFIRELEHLMKEKENEEIVGLENKLNAGNRGDLIEYALEQKEAYYKKLLASSTLLSEQEFHLHIIAQVRSRFKTIYAKIRSQEHTREQIDEEIEKLIDIIYDKLLDDPLRLNRTGIDGIIYFLTGNCYIKWH